MRTLFYGRRSTFDWWNDLAGRTHVGARPRVISEFPGRGDIDLNALLVRAYRDRSAVGAMEHDLGEDAVDEVLRRCRLMRNLPRGTALRMAGAAWSAINELLDREQPDVVVSFMVDFYILDLLERSLRARGSTFAGLVDGVIDDTMFFSARGESVVLREPDEGEVDAAVAAIMKPSFAPFLSSDRRYSVGRFARLWAYYNTRDWALEAVRRLPGNELIAQYLISGRRVPEYRVRWEDRRVLECAQQDWEQRLDAVPFDRRVFVALQMNPEASTDYWVRQNVELIDYESVILRLLQSLGSRGYTIALKDHPNMFGWRKFRFLRQIANMPHVIVVPYEVRSQVLIDRCRAVFTYQGTVGLQASMAGRTAIVVEDPYYSIPDTFIHIRSFGDLDNLPDALDGAPLVADLDGRRRALTRQMLRATLPGRPIGVLQYRRGTPRSTAELKRLGQTLTEFLPRLVDVRRECDSGSVTTPVE